MQALFSRFQNGTADKITLSVVTIAIMTWHTQYFITEQKNYLRNLDIFIFRFCIWINSEKKETIWLPIPAMLVIIFRGKLRHSAVQKRNINCFRGKPSKEASGRHWQMISVWKEGYNWNRQNTEKRRPYSKVINNISKIRGLIDYNIKCFQKAG